MTGEDVNLTPSGIGIDGFDEAPDFDVDDILSPSEEVEVIDDGGLATPESAEIDIIDDDLEIIPFIELSNDPQPLFDSGVFVVGDTGEVKVDFLFDGGKYKFELAIFSLDGMEIYEPGSETFIQEAASRALSESNLGHVVISDHTEGALFDGTLGEKTDWNQGAYQGAKSFQMRSGDEFGVMLVANGRVEEVFDNPAIGGAKRPLFSMATANPDDAFQMGQLVDVVGDGTTFVMEDQRVDMGTDSDYNDIIFRFDGATGYTEVLEDVADPDNDWRYSELGQRILSYVDESGNALKDDPGDAAYPNNPDPDLPMPEIEQTAIDQGGDSLETATLLEASYTEDIIDQVNSSDIADIYQVEGQDLVEAEISVLSGDASVSILNSEGEVLSQQVLSRGSHTLTVPEELSGDVFLKVESGDGGDTTYILRGFAGKGEEPFNIDLEFAEGLTASQQAIVREAAKSVEGLIAEGLPSAIVDGKIIDDINFKISVSNLDGASGTLAQTKIDFMRYGSLLPAQSLVKFDVDDLAELERSGQLFSVVQHELLHGLGFGNLWAAKGLIDYEKTAFSRYKGKEGVKAFKELGRTTDYINLETEGKGSADLHWHEGLFQDELMSADLGFKQDESGKVFSPLSSVTLASLADLGYKVNLDRATPNWGLLGKPPLQEGEISEGDRKALEVLISQSGNEGSSIPTMVEAVDPSEIEPEIWAHAERFDVNGEYYDWQEITIQSGDTVSEYVWDRMTHNSKLDNRSRVVRANDPRYWQFIVDRNRAFGVVNPHLIIAGRNLFLPVWNANYEAEQEQKRKEKEAELLKKLEEERKERERLEELHRQAGSGGLEWYVAKPLPEFGQNAPFETSVQDVVGSMVPDDYFRFTLSRPGWMTLYLEDLLADADLYLYDSRNRLIGKATRDGVTDEKIIMNLTAGTYLARVHSKDGLATDYNLKVRFDGLPTRTQTGSKSGPVFSDPRLNAIYETALENFAAPKRDEANAAIRDLEAEKRGYEQELEALLAQMNDEQRAKIHGALDDARHNANVWADDKANDINGGIDSAVNWILGQIDSKIPGWVYNIWGIGESLRNGKENLTNKIKEARDWLKGKVTEIQDTVKSAIWHFIQTIKDSYRTGAEINGIIENAANTMRQKIDDAVNNINRWVGDFKGQITGALDWTRSIGVGNWDFYNHVVKPLANSIANSINDKVEDVGDFAKDAVNWVKPRAQKAVAAIVDAIFGDKTAHIWNQIHGVDAQIAATRTNLEKVINAAKNHISNFVRQIEVLLSDPEERNRVLKALFDFGFNTVEEAHAFVETELPKVRQEIEEEIEQARREADKLIQVMVDNLLAVDDANDNITYSIVVTEGANIGINAIKGAKVKSSGNKILTRKIDDRGKVTYSVAQDMVVGLELQAGPEQGGEFEISGKKAALKADAKATGEANIGTALEYTFSPDVPGDMFKLGTLLFSDHVLERIPGFGQSIDTLINSLLTQNLSDLKVSLGKEVGGSASAKLAIPGVELGGAVSLKYVNNNDFSDEVKAIHSIVGGFSRNIGIGEVLGLDIGGEGRLTLSATIDEITKHIDEASMELYLAGYENLTSLRKFKPNLVNVLETAKDLSKNTKITHGYKIKMSVKDPLELGIKILSEIFDTLQNGTKPNLTMVNDFLEIFDIFKEHTSVSASVFESEQYSLKIDGKIIVGGGVDASIKRIKERNILALN